VTAPVPAALKDQRLVVVDVEGNGQQPPEIVEIAALPIGPGSRGESVRSWLIHPLREITPLIARKVHGISNADVAGCPLWTDVAPEVEDVLTGRTLVAHHASVEYRILRAHLPAWRPPMVLDTLRLAKYIWPGLDGYGLNELIAHADLGTSVVAGQRHRAGYDAWCAWQLLCVLLAQSALDWARLVKVAGLPGFVSPSAPQGLLW